MAHRVDLHEALKKFATSPDGKGTPVSIHLRHRVVGCNPSEPSITLEGGEEVKGDLVIGADGVHSVLRAHITGDDIPVKSIGMSCFRALIPTSKIQSNPRTAHLVERKGDMTARYGANRSMITYPCRANTFLNIGGFIPNDENNSASEDWNNSSSMKQLLQSFATFGDDVKEMLSMAPQDGIKIWPLLDRPALKTWCRGNAALLGDAAHPFLPFRGQGAAQAMEDAAAIAALLPLGTKKEGIEKRLEVYMQSRYERASHIQELTRGSAPIFRAEDEETARKTKAAFKPDDLAQAQNHDAFLHAQEILRQHIEGLSTGE
jgi:2-polyprenyl-6-methoxyphenol hydroxylase-like FAD-dependent oxidoreductase